MGERLDGYDVYTVWPGFRFQCQGCHKVLEPGDSFARLNDDSSAVLCLDCVHKRRAEPVERAEPAELVPERHGHRRDTDWMEYD